MIKQIIDKLQYITDRILNYLVKSSDDTEYDTDSDSDIDTDIDIYTDSNEINIKNKKFTSTPTMRVLLQNPEYKRIILYLLKLYVITDDIFNKFINVLCSFIPEHAINITEFNTKTNKIQSRIPLLYLFKYYRIPLRLHEKYYSITMWSSKEQKYVSLFIDALILSELESKIEPYIVPNILSLIKHKNSIKSIIINTTDNDIAYYVSNSQDKKLIKYYNSLVIQNNITVHALHLLYLHVNKCPTIDMFNFTKSSSIKLIHNNGYTTIFNNKNDIVFSSLDVDNVD